MSGPQYFAAMHYAMRGNEDAIALCDIIGRIVQVWDDLVDRDKEVLPRDISGAFEAALVHLPMNPFYARHINELHPLIMTAINAWHDSNALMGRGRTDDVVRAYVLRDLMDEVVIACARLVGGWDWMRHVSLQLRDAVTHTDSFEQFKTEGEDNVRN